jgi:hypothetical protein
MACIDAIEGKNDEACTWLQKAIDAGWRDYRFGAIDPLLAGLQKESRFKNMLEQVRAKVEAMRKEAEEAER